jgi:glutamate racemase
MVVSTDQIAVFDSGVGGLSVLRHLRRLLPGENFVYFGDCANAPYGCKTTARVRELTLAAVEKLVRQYPLKALVVACNTATSAAIGALREAYPNMIVIGIEPALKLAADLFPGGRIGVMATEVTLREEKFDVLMHRFNAGCAVEKIPAPGLVELIEAGKADSNDTEALLRTILTPYIGKLDALVLGCTHYPFATAAIRKILGDEVALLDGGEGTARETKRRLAAAGLINEDGPVELILTGSGNAENFCTLAETLLR